VSTYEYYEFQAIDKPLNTEQREAVQGLSSRAIVNLHSAAEASTSSKETSFQAEKWLKVLSQPEKEDFLQPYVKRL
jgi:hypothetical protein